MPQLVQPYLFFEGRCDEALEFYRTALGAEDITIMRYNENPDGNMCPEGIDGSKVMHASFRIGGSTLMASDGRCSGATRFDGFTLTITAHDIPEAERLFNALASNGGKVEMPLMETFYAKSFGMVEDKFQMGWMVIVLKECPQAGETK